MHRIALASTVVVTLMGAGAGRAADMAAVPYARPLPMAEPVIYRWTGCHVGWHAGGLVSEDRSITASGSSHGFSSPGFVGGGQVGCDYQFAPGWVAGVEGRAGWTSVENTHAASVRNLTTGDVLPSQFTLSNDFLASATARLGYGFADRWLAYVRGGAAWTHERIDDAFTKVGGIPVDPSAHLTRSGWTVGGGVDWALAPHWSANLEYNYYDFGQRSATLTGPGATVSGYSVKDTMHAVTTGVDYHF
ncbi:MAG: outer membrane beta-barrel protein [Xanthobacteraceae bacterium]|nr:outer membrane beta-barrel protein [Xanthobacteraceae bacterium]